MRQGFKKSNVTGLFTHFGGKSEETNTLTKQNAPLSIGLNPLDNPSPKNGPVSKPNIIY